MLDLRKVYIYGAHISCNAPGVSLNGSRSTQEGVPGISPGCHKYTHFTIYKYEKLTLFLNRVRLCFFQRRLQEDDNIICKFVYLRKIMINWYHSFLHKINNNWRAERKKNLHFFAKVLFSKTVCNSVLKNGTWRKMWRLSFPWALQWALQWLWILWWKKER